MTDENTETIPYWEVDTTENPYLVWPEEPITQESLREYFGLEVGPQMAMMFANSNGDIRSFAGTVAPLLRMARGVRDEHIKQLYGTTNPDDDLTVHHAIERCDERELPSVER